MNCSNAAQIVDQKNNLFDQTGMYRMTKTAVPTLHVTDADLSRAAGVGGFVALGDSPNDHPCVFIST
jgi:hypothetical protein